MTASWVAPWVKRISHALDDCYQRYVYERPIPSYRQRILRLAPWPDFPEKAAKLCSDGILILRGYFKGELLEAMRADFARRVKEVRPDAVGRVLAHEGNGAFLRDSEALSIAAVDPLITRLAGYYWGKPIVLSQSSGLRIDPDPGAEKQGPFQWHHDANRKQLKALLYLDDVSRDGQRMDYLPGTHRIWHRFKRGEDGYQETRMTDQAVLPYGEPLRCEGPAGTVLLFDTNGIHRGNRNMSAKRDVWVFQYTAGRHLEPFSGLHPQVAQRISPEQKRIARQSP